MWKLMTAAVALFALMAGEAQARGFGGFRAGGFGGYRAGGFGGYGGSYRAGGFREAGFGAYGGYHAGGAEARSYTGPRGSTVDAGRAGGYGVGPYGGFHAGGAGGVRVTTPGGRTFSEGRAGGIGVGPAGGVRAGGIEGAGVRGPYGAAGGFRAGGFEAGRYGAYAGGVRVGGVAGAGGFAAAGHVTRYVSPAAFHAQAVAVRTGGGWGYTCFTPSWYRLHPVVWAPARWATPTFWVAPLWPALVSWCDVPETPVTYDYGSNVVINENNVFVDGTKTATAPQYAEQAITIADAGRKADAPAEEEWRPLGVFGLVQGQEEIAQNLFQLAINKAGVVRGNYYDALADNNLKVFGSLDRKTQRVCWSIGEKKDIVYEAGLNNLTKDETTVLVHYGKDRTRQMMLVRIEQPKDDTKGGGER
jgi:hypothetical protein